MQPYRQQRNTGRRTWQVLLVLLAVLAAGVQQVVAQTHWHNPAVASQVGSGSPDDDTGKHDDCLWCQIAAHASAAAPPLSIQVLVAQDALVVRVPLELHAVAIPRPAHAWQSRGPPSL
jgi:Protein of unknown function (DUF2946)